MQKNTNKCNLDLEQNKAVTNNNILLQGVCPPKWDNASCIPPTLAGETAVFPCMAVFNGETYSPHCKFLYILCT